MNTPEITTELLSSIYTRANQYAIKKWGTEPDQLTINSYGNIEAEYRGYERDHLTIKISK